MPVPVSEKEQDAGLEMTQLKNSNEAYEAAFDLEGDHDEEAITPGRQRADSGAIDLSEPVDIWTWDNCGYLAQYFAVGLIYGGLPATLYGVFRGYLACPGYVYSTTRVIITLPWSFKFLFGLINDTCPILNYRRKPYMVIGWAFCTVALMICWFSPLPDPYYCKDSEGKYIMEVADENHPGKLRAVTAKEACNPDAPKEGGYYAILMTLAALGYVIADVAADGLTVQYARREPVEVRGQTQTTIYLIRVCGQIVAVFLVAFGMNTYEYNGTFSVGFSWNTILAILAIPSICMVPLSWYRIVEPEVEETTKIGEYFSGVWTLLQSKAMFWVIMYSFWNPVVSYIGTTAGGQVKQHWAQVKNLQNQLFSLLGLVIFAFGLWLTKRYFLSYSWRCMLITTTIFLNGVDMLFSYPTIYDVIRNQYFYLGEEVLLDIPSAANFVVGTFYIVEMADDGNEGLVYGLLTTIANLGGPVANALSNQIFEMFTPALSDDANYIEDSSSFRNTVAESFTLSYFFAFAGMAFVFLLPTQKAQAQLRKKTWPHNIAYAWISVIIIGVAFIYSMSVNILSLFPSTMCLKYAGGNGCD